MFDVSWTDPTRETVGQRKNRKDQQTNRLSGGYSVKSSNSSESQTQQSQTRPSLLNLFVGNGHKKSLKRTESHPRLPTQELGDKSIKASRQISSFAISDVSCETLPTTRLPLNTFFPGAEAPPYHLDHGHSSASDGEDSVFSGWTGHSGNTESTWGSVIESSPNPREIINSTIEGSFVTQSTDVTVSLQESIRSDEQVASQVSISAASTVPIEIRDTQRKGSTISSTFDFPLPNTAQRPESLILPPSPIIGRSDSQKISWPITSRWRQSDSWRPPDEWECLNEVHEPSTLLPRHTPNPPPLPLTNSRPKRNTQRLTDPQKKIRRMSAASSKIILERLTEEWSEVADAFVYRELELEKQLWMLTALEHLKKRSSMDLSLSAQMDRISLEEDFATTKLLSLYENHASASFLSAVHPTPRIHHISTFPISPLAYPNIHPLAVPSPSPHLPYASNLFASIHAFSLPATLPASSIPTLLRECHRTLRSSLAPINTIPGLLYPSSPISPSSSSTRTIVPYKSNSLCKAGSIHLTILDPGPLPDTLGPKLRLWLDKHLLLNLERQFRCINPGRLFPVWLADAGLRGEGSTIVTVQFLACANDFESDAHCLSPISPFNSSQKTEAREADEAASMKRDLKSVVGRMLWKEMWGALVEGENWWWEDDGIVNECVRLGTRWEYVVIEGIRRDRSVGLLVHAGVQMQLFLIPGLLGLEKCVHYR